jgi:hypothetical protein
MLVAFFAGVLVTLYLLSPGERGPTILVSGDRHVQLGSFNRAADKIEEMADVLALYAQRAREDVSDHFADS